ncbi:MAG: GNAT family N-acetyltransferase [Oscillospiraceae bacterium]|nr:GNAT family N-acetyltransferase [Oscillospiraceae bacterium]
MAKIYLVRHCESEGNACRRTQAQTDALVTTKGYAQAEMLRQRFRDIPVDAVYSSDTYRALATGEPVAADHGAPVRVRISLRELTTGVWEDMAWGNIAQEYPEANRVWYESPWEAITPGASSFERAAQRVIHCLRRIAREVGENGTAVAISHSCAIKSALCLLMGKPISAGKEVQHSDNTAVSLLHVDADGGITIEYMNDASHLPPELSRAWNGVAGDELNMAICPIRMPEQEETLLALAEAEAKERGAAFDRAAYRTELHVLLARHPGYVALSYLHGRVTGFVRLEPCRAAGCPVIRTMYVLPELRGKGYAEQLFGHATWVLRYSDQFDVAVPEDATAEERRVAERFPFAAAENGYRRLHLACRPCPYPILA